MSKKPQAQPITPQAPAQNSNLPEQLRRQIAEADAVRAGMEAAPPPPPDGGEPPPAPAPQSGPPPAQVPPPPAQQPPPAPETIEQQLRSTQGRLEQQLATNRDLHNRLGQLEQTLATLTAAGAQPPAPPPAPEPVRLVTPEEEADFGVDLLNVVGKKAKEVYAPEFEQLASRLRALEGRVDGTAAVLQKTQQKTLYETLDTDVATWRDINRSDEFKAWLNNVDVMSGRRRFDMLQEAFSRQDAPRVVAFFKGFLTEAASPPSNPSGQRPSAPPLANPSANGAGNGSGKVSLEELAAPGRARSAPQDPLSPDKPVYTAAWIAKFMADKRTGKYRGREADADAIERDIYQAQHEGRIQ